MPEPTLEDAARSRSLGSSPTVAFLSLGCRANQEEIECILGSLREKGFRLTEFGKPADWVVINTCSVTSAGESDTRQMIRRAVRDSGGGRIVVTGCYAQQDPVTAARLGADLVIGNSEKWRLPDLIALAAAGTEACTGILFQPDPTTQRFLRHGNRASGYRTRAALKIQDGCDERCTYCIIPSLRGRGVSRDPDEVLCEARTLVASGHPEITLTGIHSASYRWGEGGLDALLRRLLEVPGLRRIRVNSLEPQWVGPELIDTIASSERFARHLHLPLQSGDAGVLKRMGRGYSPDEYGRVVRAARERIRGVAIGADVMVGFPGEDEAAFERSAALLESVRPAYLHVFPYSERPGTAACRLPGPVTPRIARTRAAHLAQLDRRFRSAFLEASEGEEHEILIEARRDRQGRRLGLTDTFIRVAIPTEQPPGSWARVQLRYTGDPREMTGEMLA
jgi:threonylcarbamoyladenosine tRNA methylthiotransferase MtaB